MQKIFLVLFSLILFASQAHAVSQIVPPTPTPTAIPTPTPTYIHYDLPFPGILPGHPIYKLKVIRDKIIGALISDPKGKIDFYLRQTDKGMLAAAMLVDQGKFELVKDTVLKAEHNYTLLTYQLYKINGNPGVEFFRTLATASAKHQEVLTSLLPRVPVGVRQTLVTVISFSVRNLASVQKFEKQLNNE